MMLSTLQNKLWQIDAVLIPDLTSPAKEWPELSANDTTIFEAIGGIPGLEDLHAAVSKDAELVKLLSNTTGAPITFLAPSNFAQNELRRATGQAPAELFNNATWLSRNVRNLILTANGALTANQTIALKGKNLTTALTGR
jgi:hypothetical protein